ncbi:unnamed protein product [Pedinophyceae sp. YPF-701]|nr:unnamed protein product [Pedinophyceae sp. YPF-701]
MRVGSTNGCSTTRSFRWEDIEEVRRVTERNFESGFFLCGCCKTTINEGKCYIEMQTKHTIADPHESASFLNAVLDWARLKNGLFSLLAGFPTSGGKGNVFRVRVHPQDAPRILTAIFGGLTDYVAK